MPHHWRSDHQTDPSGRPGTLGTAVARLSRLLPGCADAGSDRAHMGGAVRPGLGRCTASLPNRRISWPGGRIWSSIPLPGPRTCPATWRTSTSPSSGAAATLHTGSSRPSTHSPMVSAPPAFLGSPRSTTPGTLPIRHPRSSDIVRRVPALSLPEDSAPYCRRRRLPWADSLRHAEAEIAVFAGFPEVDRSTPQPESQPTAESSYQPDQDQQRSDQQAGAEWSK